jgi:hypothetical protein
MALSGSVLKTAIINAFIANGNFDVDGWMTPNYFEEFIEVISDEIIDHFKDNAVVSITTTSGAPDSEHTGTGTVT